MATLVGVLSGATGGVTYLSSKDNVACPVLRDATATITTEISISAGVLAVSSTADVAAKEVTPRNPPKSAMTVGLDYDLARCILGSSGNTTAMNWKDGRATFKFKLNNQIAYGWHDSSPPSDNIGFSPNIARLRITPHGSRIDIQPCAESSGVCSGATSVSNVVVLKKSESQGFLAHLQAPRSSPVPSLIETGDTQRIEWSIEPTGGPSMDTAELKLDVPPLVIAQSFLQSDQGSFRIADIGRGELRFSLNFLLLAALSGMAMLATAAIILRSSPRRPPALALVLSLLLIGALEFSQSQFRQSRMDQAILLSVGWAVATIALTSRNYRGRIAATVLGLVLALFGPVLAFAQLSETSRYSDQDPTPLFALVVSIAGFLLLTSLGAMAASSLIYRIFGLVELSDQHRLYATRIMRVVVVSAMLGLLAYPFGAAFADRDSSTTYAVDLAREVVAMSSSAAYALTALLPVIVTAYVAWSVADDATARSNAAIPILSLALAVSIAAPWNVDGSTTFVVELPLWLLMLAVLGLVLGKLNSTSTVGHAHNADSDMLELTGDQRRPSAQATAHPPLAALPIGTEPHDLLDDVNSELLRAQASQRPRRAMISGPGDRRRRSAPRLIRRGSHGQASSGSHPKKYDPGRELLLAGNGGTWFDGGRQSAKYGAIISAAFVAYFTWAAIGQLSSSATWSAGLLMVVISIVTETVRWVFLSFTFGCLYRILPGRIGPIRAAVFSAVWIGGALIPLLVSRGLGYDQSQQLLYRSAQTVLFLVVLSLTCDLMTVRHAGGSWRNLRDVYNLASYGQLIASAAPIVLVALTLAQQVISGSGFDVASSFVDGLSKIVSP